MAEDWKVPQVKKGGGEMSIVKKIEQAIADHKTQEENDEGFKKLNDFYNEMLRLGVATKKEYTLPPITRAAVDICTSAYQKW